MGFWFWLKALALVVVVHNQGFFYAIGEHSGMKEVDSYKEDDYRYKDYELDKKEIKKLSKYFNHQFNKVKTRLLIVFSFMGDMVSAQIQEDSTWDLSPEEYKKLFKKIPD